MGIDLPYVTKGLKVVKVTDTRIIFMHAKGSSRTEFHDEIVVLMVTKRKRGGKFSTMTFKFKPHFYHIAPSSPAQRGGNFLWLQKGGFPLIRGKPSALIVRLSWTKDEWHRQGGQLLILCRELAISSAHTDKNLCPWQVWDGYCPAYDKEFWQWLARRTRDLVVAGSIPNQAML